MVGWGGGISRPLFGCVPLRRNKGRALERKEFNPLFVGQGQGQGQGQAGLGREAELTAYLQGFVVFLFVHTGGLSPCKLFWILTLHRVGVCFLLRPTREGREVGHWSQTKWSSGYMNLLPNFKQIDLLSLLLPLTQLYRHRVSVSTNRYMLSNCLPTVECLSQQQGPALGKTTHQLKWISSSSFSWPNRPRHIPHPPPTPQHNLVVKEIHQFLDVGVTFSWCSIFILIIGLIFWFPVHHLIWPATLWGKQW